MERLFDSFFQDAPPELDLVSIRHEWDALQTSPYHIADRHPPIPVWAQRGLSETGPQAWAILRAEVSSIDP